LRCHRPSSRPCELVIRERGKKLLVPLAGAVSERR
jgi:hypothetical protein